MRTHAGHVLHEDGERSLHCVSQAAVVLHNPLVAQVLQELDFTLQRAHLLNTTANFHLFLLCPRFTTFISRNKHSPCWSPDSPGQTGPVSPPVPGQYRHHNRGKPVRRPPDPGAFRAASWSEHVELLIQTSDTIKITGRTGNSCRTGQ